MARKKPVKQAKTTSARDLAPASEAALPQGYRELLEDLKGRVRTAQLKAAVAVNREMIQLYWDIGRLIVERQEREGWGKGIVDRLAEDIQKAFPGLKGFSPSNVWRMRSFYLAYTKEVTNLAQAVRDLDGQSLPQAVAEVPWGHNVILIEKLKDPLQRLWYAQQTVQHGWSRTILELQIRTNLYGRQGKAVTNFAATLPPPQSDLAQQTLKDPYVFDFLTLDAAAHERDLEGGLLAHIRKFLLELGVGFAFVGSQVHMEVGDEDFYLDLLFYHLKLRCFVVIDLKADEFKPEDAGKMNFYLSAVDDKLRHPDDRPSIGLILCRTRHRLIVEYALRDLAKPIGVAEWQTRLVQSLPEELRGSLPSIAELEAELSKDLSGPQAEEAEGGRSSSRP
jgi:predicted nuclease of restriction endonuclease-like (RecB) superfamily